MTKNMSRNMSFQQGWFVLVFGIAFTKIKFHNNVPHLISSTKGVQVKQSKPL